MSRAVRELLALAMRARFLAPVTESSGKIRGRYFQREKEKLI